MALATERKDYRRVDSQAKDGLVKDYSQLLKLGLASRAAALLGHRGYCCPAPNHATLAILRKQLPGGFDLS